MRVSKKTLISLIAVIIFGLLSSGAAAKDLYKIKCIFPFWLGFGPTFLASDLGYFEEEGVEVSIAFDDDRGNVLPAMIRGDCDCSERTIGEYLTRPRTPETTGVAIGAIDVSLGADSIIADGSIKTVADLKGKIYAGEPNHPAYMLLQLALKEAGVAWKDINYRPIQTADAMAIFEDPSIAALGGWEPMIGAMLKATKRKGAHILLDSGDYPGLIVDVIVIRSEQLKAHRDKYAGFLRAIYRAIDYINENPGKAIEMMAPHYRLTPEEFKESLDVGVEYTGYEKTVKLFGTSGNRGSIHKTFDSLMDIALEHDFNDVRLSAESSIDNTLLGDLWKGHKR
ncbi:MAG: ABC transporter substrate-binding protein [bacterium]|nr:ABC transporter substrate-binding protein [bacterium]